MTLAAGIVDAAPSSLEEAIAEADLIVVGLPTLSVGGVLATFRDHGRPGAIVTDVVSVKGSVVEAARQVFGTVPTWLVPGHPIAGAEKSGVQAARAELVQRHRVILTPLADSKEGYLSCLGLLGSLGYLSWLSYLSKMSSFVIPHVTCYEFRVTRYELCVASCELLSA